MLGNDRKPKSKEIEAEKLAYLSALVTFNESEIKPSQLNKK
jgi:hypothetical protein